MKDPHDVVKSLIRTEKGSNMLPQNKYLFMADRCANKIEIRKAVEDIYKVKVASVNTSIMPGKMKRVRYKLGMTVEWKKAVVTLREGSKIDVV